MGLTNQETAEPDSVPNRRSRELRAAASFVAESLTEMPRVQKVALFGSAAQPPEKEPARGRGFRRAGAAVRRECQNVYLAVWISSLEDLKQLQRARSLALANLLREQRATVAPHQVDVFLLDPLTDRYLGRLCTFGVCPKDKIECYVPGCGKVAFLRQHAGFELDPELLSPHQSVVLFDRTRSAAADGTVHAAGDP